jgi:hypothetical protein
MTHPVPKRLRHLAAFSILGIAVLMGTLAACAPGSQPPQLSDDNSANGDHMVAQAMLTAHFIKAAVDAGYSADEINRTLASITQASVIDEFWVSDADGNIDYTSNPEIDFTFPVGPDAQGQAAPFADLIAGEETVVIQEPMPRQFDEKLFQYVGVAGADQPRIVQVGIDRSQ